METEVNGCANTVDLNRRHELDSCQKVGICSSTLWRERPSLAVSEQKGSRKEQECRRQKRGESRQEA